MQNHVLIKCKAIFKQTFSWKAPSLGKHPSGNCSQGGGGVKSGVHG